MVSSSGKRVVENFRWWHKRKGPTKFLVHFSKTRALQKNPPPPPRCQRRAFTAANFCMGSVFQLQKGNMGIQRLRVVLGTCVCLLAKLSYLALTPVWGNQELTFCRGMVCLRLERRADWAPLVSQTCLAPFKALRFDEPEGRPTSIVRVHIPMPRHGGER